MNLPITKDTRAIQLNYKKYGTNGPALLILHGLFGSHSNWSKVCERLAEDFTVYALDLRNHGTSPHTAEFDYVFMAADVNAFLDRMGITEAIALGHSMGGKVAMTFAMAHPKKVSKLIVADIAPRSYKEEGEGQNSLVDALLQLDLSTHSRQKDIHKTLTPAIPSSEVRYFLLTNLLRDSHRNFKWRVNLESISANLGKLQGGIPKMSTFQRPTMFLKGEFSDFITSEDLILISKHFPLSQLKTVRGAGHWVHYDAMETFVQMVREFL